MKTFYKRIFAIFFVLLTPIFFATCLFLPSSAKGEETQWVRVLEEDVALFPTASTIKTTCILQKSYYLRVLEQTADFFFVQLMEANADFPSITGYVLKDSVQLSSDTPASPIYPTKKLTVSASNANLYFSPLFSSSILIVATNTQTMCFYGSITQNDVLWYYVYFAGVFGYVDSSCVTNPQIALHPTPLPSIQPPLPDPNGGNPATPPQQPDPIVSIGEILMIAFVAALSIGLVLALFLPQSAKKKKQPFDKYG